MRFVQLLDIIRLLNDNMYNSIYVSLATTVLGLHVCIYLQVYKYARVYYITMYVLLTVWLQYIFWLSVEIFMT